VGKECWGQKRKNEMKEWQETQQDNDFKTGMVTNIKKLQCSQERQTLKWIP
jgi:hypothetical protein